MFRELDALYHHNPVLFILTLIAAMLFIPYQAILWPDTIQSVFARAAPQVASLSRIRCLRNRMGRLHCLEAWEPINPIWSQKATSAGQGCRQDRNTHGQGTIIKKWLCSRSNP
jgi:hypothetical protein